MVETKNKKEKIILKINPLGLFPFYLGMLLVVGISSFESLCQENPGNQVGQGSQDTHVENQSSPAKPPVNSLNPASQENASPKESAPTPSEGENDKGSETENKKEEEEDQPVKIKPQPLIANPPQRIKRNNSVPSKMKKRSVKNKVQNEKEKSGTEGNVKEESKEKSKGQWSIVVTDGAAIYKSPSFDAPILDYVSSGKKIRISQKIYMGNGGFGAFYRVKVSAKVLGYIADVDVKPEFKNRDPNSITFQNKKLSSLSSPKNEETLPISYARFFGVTYGTAGFAEKLSGRRFASQEWLTGLRLVGPGALMEGIPLDVSVLFHMGVPRFYRENMTSGSPSGYFVLADVFLPFPFKETRNFLLSWGLGLMSVYTRFNLQVRNTIFDSQELRMGLAAQLGGTYRWGRYGLRFEGKYFYEKSDYFGFFGTFMLRY